MMRARARARARVCIFVRGHERSRAGRVGKRRVSTNEWRSLGAILAFTGGLYVVFTAVVDEMSSTNRDSSRARKTNLLLSRT